MTSRPVRRTQDGFYSLSLPAEERSLLADLPAQMRELFANSDDPAMQRLLPVAYPNDPDRQTEYRLLVQDELMASHDGALSVLEETAGADRVTEEQLLAWVRAINQVRLVMGERLKITEEGAERPRSRDDPRLPGFAVYDYLSELQDDIIAALSAGGGHEDS
ncbi:MAG TPA: DUF2017 family protein [Acidimicrobiales bacterium]|jgi:hypothetical protein